MKPIRVMIVDDEILAIEHIRQLVPWEQLGYEIACVTTNPLQAPELAAKQRPELAIMDIVMPGMDGLALTERITSVDSIRKIVLLTSYKEFDYAKKAVKLGVSNYWVKHEMNADTLSKELSELRQEIERERQRVEENRNRLLMDWLGGRPLTDEQWSAAASGKASAHGCLHLVVAQPDRPFPLLSGIVPETDTPAMPDDWPEREDPNLIASIRFLDNLFVLLYADNGLKGESKMREFIEGKAAQAREILERITEMTVSLSLAAGMASREEVPVKLAEAVRLLSHSVFAGPRQIFRLNDIRSDRDVVRPLIWEEGLHQIRNGVSERKFEDAGKALTELFLQAEAARDLAGFSDMCRQLASLLNRSRIALRLPSLKEAWEGGSFTSARWDSVSNIRSWFLREFGALAEADSLHSPVSRKVRQAIDFMELHFSDGDLNADSIAQHLGISRDHLRHVFKEETGQTLLDKLTDIRMEHAKTLLDQGNLKIYEIAERVGFRNSQYFSQVFRKSTGVNPLDFAERKR
ncbi:helix-turn-helix domain-containing protein [Cohnella candidum]|uniref:Helix-turn-helix domain-containing protein n=1 Tax=Cohnella candidum TaxID=2674991 RepID=A0A3G3JYQ0_9BACL|nr:helix-turn-helix domain-containing protein [Cohnella candidum]AYQ73323.1 helix-turn-helix domain-containing protein [Cohnella candidum]